MHSRLESTGEREREEEEEGSGGGGGGEVCWKLRFIELGKLKVIKSEDY